MAKKYIVKLYDDEQAAIDRLLHKGKVAVRKVTRANILRLANDNHTDEEIAAMLKTSVATIERVREKFVVGGLDGALKEDPRAGAPSKLDGKQAAFLVALACSEPPTGHHEWTMQLLADKLLTLQVIEQTVSDETVRRALKKHKPWLKSEWCIPTVSAEFVWRMEDVLDLYAEPYNPCFPVVCFDERPYQLIGETRQPLPMKAGQPRRYDYEYQRNGTCNLFTYFQPLAGWRHVVVTAQRTRQDFARRMQELVDVHFPQAELIHVVLDNLNIHTPAALYEVFTPAEARRLVRHLDFRYTPKHGSWLNMAEIEIAVLSSQCLDRRIPKIDKLSRETAAWEIERNARKATVNWQFDSTKARTKLSRLYPS
ncbi:MAG: IS630 family transposase [Nitrososphaera sp.]